MPNILVIKLEANFLMTSFKVNQDYSGATASCTELIARKAPAKSLLACALCDSDEWTSLIEAGTKAFVPGEGGASDFDLKQKSAITTETIILPDGVAIEDIDASDYVVCYV